MDNLIKEIFLLKRGIIYQTLVSKRILLEMFSGHHQ